MDYCYVIEYTRERSRTPHGDNVRYDRVQVCYHAVRLVDGVPEAKTQCGRSYDRADLESHMDWAQAQQVMRHPGCRRALGEI